MWIRFNLAFAFTLTAAIGGALLFVMLVDPLGISPIALISDRHVVYNDRRQAMPQIVRSRRYDSFIVGSSTTITLDPEWAESAFGGRFANVAIQGATPYEQGRVIGLVATQAPRMILHGLDAGWCAQSASKYHPWWPFPEWLYADIHLYDFGRLLNWHVVRLAISKARLALGLDPPVVLANGFETQLPKDSTWTLAKARARLYAQGATDARIKSNDDNEPPISSSPTRAGTFPALDLLRDAIARVPPSTKLVILFMPVHVAALPHADTDRYSRLEACKRRVAEIARRPNAYVIDFMQSSSITREDRNFWDSIHLREGPAKDLIESTRMAMERRESAGDGTYRYLSGPGRQSGPYGH